MKYETPIVGMANKQLLEGVNIQGKIMQKGYSPGYGKLRKKKGLQTSYVDLKFTGEYQKTKKMVIDAQLRGIDIISNADYEMYLRKNFPDHVGLTEPNAKIIEKPIADDVAVLIDRYLS